MSGSFQIADRPGGAHPEGTQAASFSIDGRPHPLRIQPLQAIDGIDREGAQSLASVLPEPAYAPPLEDVPERGS